jgi:DNA-binding transcriptional LysR family regulator
VIICVLHVRVLVVVGNRADPGDPAELARRLDRCLQVIAANPVERGVNAVRRGLGQQLAHRAVVVRAVRECERKAGTVLFERGRTGARPTAAGQVALVHARHILRQLDLLGTEVRSAAAGPLSGTLRIAAFRRAAARLLPPALARLAARYPALRPQILIVPELGRGTAGEVADGHADLAISTLPTDGKALPGLVTRELLREPFLLAAPPVTPTRGPCR